MTIHPEQQLLPLAIEAARLHQPDLEREMLQAVAWCRASYTYLTRKSDAAGKGEIPSAIAPARSRIAPLVRCSALLCDQTAHGSLGELRQLASRTPL